MLRVFMSELTIICYPKCGTCKKAEAYLHEHGISYKYRDIQKACPSFDELKEWLLLSAKDINKFFNTSGLVYRSLNLKEKLPNMNDDEKLRLLASDGMLIKRPLLITKDKVLIGFRIKEWDEYFGR